MSFDEKEYKKEYNKKHYTTKTIRLKPDFWLKIDEYCKYNGIGINEFFNLSAKYILDEEIDLNGYK